MTSLGTIAPSSRLAAPEGRSPARISVFFESCRQGIVLEVQNKVSRSQIAVVSLIR